MRITTNAVYQGIYNSTNNELKSLQDLQQRSTIKLLSAADDPSGYQLVSRIESRMGGMEAYSYNMESAKAYHQDIDASMKQSLSLVDDVDVTIAKASNGTWSADDLSLMADDIDATLEQLVDSINGKSSFGDYVFSGTEGKTPPYDVTRDASGEITAVNYVGNQQVKNIQISPTQTIEATAIGEKVFGPSGNDIFQSLIDLRDQMRTGTFTGAEGDTFSNEIEVHRKTMISQRSKSGVENNRIDKIEQFNESMKDNFREILVKTKDADFTQVATDMMKHKTALQMSAQLGKVLSNMTFVDFN